VCVCVCCSEKKEVPPSPGDCLYIIYTSIYIMVSYGKVTVLKRLLSPFVFRICVRLIVMMT